MSYKIELHLHTKGTSHCAKVEPERIIEIYKDAGYDAIVCTNHLNNASWKYLKGLFAKAKINTYLSAFDRLNNAGIKNGIKVYFGIELALKNEDYCGKRSNCAEMLIYGITRDEFIKYNKLLISLSHKEFFNLAHANGWTIIQAHPYRPNSKQLDKEFIDGVEIYNSHPGHNNHNDLALQLQKKYEVIGTCGSDYHFEGMEGSGITTQILPKDEKELSKLLKSKSFSIIHK